MEQEEQEGLTIARLEDGIYRIHEAGNMNVNAYLVMGSRRAVVIDGLFQEPGLYQLIRQITGLPLSMIVTHGHPDHAGVGMQECIEAGCEIYITAADRKLAQESFDSRIPDRNFRKLEGTMQFDLGGITLETMAMPGHTQGSVLVYARERKLLFSSDAVGSGGIWMMLPESSPLSEYFPQVEGLLGFLKENGPIRIYPGHSGQTADADAGTLGQAYVEELLEMTKDIVTGRLVGEPMEPPMPDMQKIRIRRAVGRLVTGYCYDEDKKGR